MSNLKQIKPKRTGTRVVFLARVSFCHLDQPWSGAEGNDKKYSVSAIIPKGDKETIAEINAAIDEAYTQGVAKAWKGTKPNRKSVNFKNPLKDGDTERPDDPVYAESYFIGANSKTKVPTLNRLKEPIDPTEVYSGCYALVSVNFYAFSQGSNGIAAGLNAVLKYADGEKLSGGNSGERDFDEFDLESDEDLDNL